MLAIIKNADKSLPNIGSLEVQRILLAPNGRKLIVKIIKMKTSP